MPGGAVTVVCCIEAGFLEDQTLRMLRTLRGHGGRLAGAPVLAVGPRRNAPIRASTRQALRALDVEHVVDPSQNPMPWFNFANKIAATLIAEKRATTPTVLWLDSDIIVAEEPSSCLLEADADFAGRGEPLAPATRDPGDPYEAFWRRACGHLDIDFDALPFLDLEPPHRPVRLYVNGGVFAWRRGKGYVESYRDTFLEVMRRRITPPNGDNSLNEQFCVALAAHRIGLRFRQLDRRDNHFAFPDAEKGPGGPLPLGDARIIHYSKSGSGSNWPLFVARLRRERPEIAEEFAGPGPIRRDLDPVQKAIYWPFKVARKLQFDRNARRSIAVGG